MTDVTDHVPAPERQHEGADASKVPVNDRVTVLGSSLMQPISDHIDKMLQYEERERPSHGENGYAALLIVALNVLLESYIARLRYTRREDLLGKASLMTQLVKFFDDLPEPAKLVEVYVVGKAVAHNHIWHLVEDEEGGDLEVLLTPSELGMATKKDWNAAVDMQVRKTRLLELNVVPTAVDRHDVKAVFDVVWSTLRFMATKSYADTPVHPRSTIRFQGKHVGFGDLLDALPPARRPSRSATSRKLQRRRSMNRSVGARPRPSRCRQPCSAHCFVFRRLTI